VLPIEDVPPDGLILTMSAVWQTKVPPGPAGRWLVDRLKQIPVESGTCPKESKELCQIEGSSTWGNWSEEFGNFTPPALVRSLCFARARNGNPRSPDHRLEPDRGSI
jgi:hypothetical protein